MVGWRRVKRLEQMRTGWGKRIPLLDKTPFTKLWVGGREKEKGPIPCMHVLYTRGSRVARARYTQVHARPCTTRQYQWETLASLPGALCNPQAGTQQRLVRQPGQKRRKIWTETGSRRHSHYEQSRASYRYFVVVCSKPGLGANLWPVATSESLSSRGSRWATGDRRGGAGGLQWGRPAPKRYP